MEDSEEADLGAEPLQIGRDLDKSVGDETKQQVVEWDRLARIKELSLSGSVNTRWKYGVGSSSASRAARRR